jgi:ABC-type bacteriocin/lantibiotic exporter with double-glycine peptidase domain
MAEDVRLAVAAQGGRIALDTPHFRQRHAMCGPASLRIVLAYFRKAMPERVIARACRSSDKTGTAGTNLVCGARRLGFTATMVDGADLRTVRRWLAKDVPVIVDWMSAIAHGPTRDVLPCGHYSVVCGLDHRPIFLPDPATGRRRRMVRRRFLDLWFDFEGVRPCRKDLILRRLIVVEPKGVRRLRRHREQ